MNPTHTILAILLAVLMLPASATGQAEDGVTEDIVVAKQKSSRDLRRDLWRAEKDFYAIYNKLNDDGIYDVVCRKQAPTGSMIKTQVCRPKFLDRAIKEGKVGKGTKLDSNSELQGKIATFRENLATLVAEDPDLKAAAATLNTAHARVTADKERRASN